MEGTAGQRLQALSIKVFPPFRARRSVDQLEFESRLQVTRPGVSEESAGGSQSGRATWKLLLDCCRRWWRGKGEGDRKMVRARVMVINHKYTLIRIHTHIRMHTHMNMRTHTSRPQKKAAGNRLGIRRFTLG